MAINDPFQGAEPAYLGKKDSVYGGLDTFDNPGNALVRLTSDEVTSLCPITGQPDFLIVDVTYAPRQLCIESKSFKLLMHSLRDTAAFTESLAMELARTISKAVVPSWVRVDVSQKARGGVSIVAVAVLHRNGSENGREKDYVVGTPLSPVEPPPNLWRA